MMEITTKVGDGGDTFLNGTKVRKDDVLLDFYGSVEELCAFLSITEQNLLDESTAETLAIFQEMLIMRDFTDKNTEQFTGLINEISKDISIEFGEDEDGPSAMPPDHSVPKMGSSIRGSHLFYCRALSRKVERKAVAADMSIEIIKFFNRLSDLLQVMAILEDAEMA